MAGENNPNDTVIRRIRSQISDTHRLWRDLPTIDRFGIAYTAMVLIFVHVLIFWILSDAAEATHGTNNFMPMIWALGKFAVLWIVGFWLSQLNLPAAIMTSIWSEKPGSHTKILVEDLRWTRDYIAHVWPASVAIPAFIVFFGMANLFVIASLDSEPGLQSSVAALTVMNSMLVLSIGAIALNPMPNIIEDVRDEWTWTVQRRDD